MTDPLMSLDKNDLWLLEVVIELATPLRMLLGSRGAEALNMRRGHGLSREALCEKLVSLSGRGLIRVSQSEKSSVVARTHAEIERVLVEGPRSDPNAFSYELTPRGGEAWEHSARPDWNRYAMAETGYKPEVCVIEAVSLEAAEREFQRHDSSGDEYRPLPETKRGEVLMPWQATYWKTLPTGYRLTYAWVHRKRELLQTLSRKPEAPWYSSLPLG